MDMLEIIRHKLNWIRDAKSGVCTYPGDLDLDEVIWQQAYFAETGQYWDPIYGESTTTIPLCLIRYFHNES